MMSNDIHVYKRNILYLYNNACHVQILLLPVIITIKVGTYISIVVSVVYYLFFYN